MPEVVKLICDVDRSQEGRRYTIEGTNRPMTVILCEEHAKPIVECFTKYGKPVPGIRAPRSRGSSEERLRSMIRDE